MDVLLCCCLLLLLASAASAGSERCVQQGKAAYSASLSPFPRYGSSGACGYGAMAAEINGGFLAAGGPRQHRGGLGCGRCFQMRCRQALSVLHWPFPLLAAWSCLLVLSCSHSQSFLSDRFTVRCSSMVGIAMRKGWRWFLGEASFIKAASMFLGDDHVAPHPDHILPCSPLSHTLQWCPCPAARVHPCC